MRLPIFTIRLVLICCLWTMMEIEVSAYVESRPWAEQDLKKGEEYVYHFSSGIVTHYFSRAPLSSINDTTLLAYAEKGNSVAKAMCVNELIRRYDDRAFGYIIKYWSDTSQLQMSIGACSPILSTLSKCIQASVHWFRLATGREHFSTLQLHRIDSLLLRDAETDTASLSCTYLGHHPTSANYSVIRQRADLPDGQRYLAVLRAFSRSQDRRYFRKLALMTLRDRKVEATITQRQDELLDLMSWYRFSGLDSLLIAQCEEQIRFAVEYDRGRSPGEADSTGSAICKQTRSYLFALSKVENRKSKSVFQHVAALNSSRWICRRIQKSAVDALCSIRSNFFADAVTLFDSAIVAEGRDWLDKQRSHRFEGDPFVEDYLR